MKISISWSGIKKKKKKRKQTIERRRKEYHPLNPNHPAQFFRPLENRDSWKRSNNRFECGRMLTTALCLIRGIPRARLLRDCFRLLFEQTRSIRRRKHVSGLKAGRVVSSGRNENGGGYNLYYPPTISVERIEDARITLITVDTSSNIMRNALGVTNLPEALPRFSPLNKISLPAYKTPPIVLQLFLLRLSFNNLSFQTVLDSLDLEIYVDQHFAFLPFKISFPSYRTLPIVFHRKLLILRLF